MRDENFYIRQKNAAQAAIIVNNNKRLNRINEYNLNPKKCLQCDTPDRYMTSAGLETTKLSRYDEVNK